MDVVQWRRCCACIQHLAGVEVVTFSRAKVRASCASAGWSHAEPSGSGAASMKTRNPLLVALSLLVDREIGLCRIDPVLGLLPLSPRPFVRSCDATFGHSGAASRACSASMLVHDKSLAACCDCTSYRIKIWLQKSREIPFCRSPILQRGVSAG